MSGLDSGRGKELLDKCCDVERQLYLALAAFTQVFPGDAFSLIGAMFLGAAEAQAELNGKLATDEIIAEIDGRKITIKAKQT